MKLRQRLEGNFQTQVIGLILVFVAGLPHFVCGGWQPMPEPGWEVYRDFVYNGHTTDLYRYNNVNRFWYDQGPGQWFDRSAVNGNWSVLGDPGQPRPTEADLHQSFIGNHHWYTFAGGKQFYLNSNNEWGTWVLDGQERFLYDYARGQWCTHSNVTDQWACLGPDKQLSAFIADHEWHKFDDNRSWQYDTTDNKIWGVWKENDQYRFAYDYATGQWKHRWAGDGNWGNLGWYNQSAQYIGDHTRHNLGGGYNHYYKFWEDNLSGVWEHYSSYRFRYWYATGQWEHHHNLNGNWHLLGGKWNTAALLDGSYHLLIDQGRGGNVPVYYQYMPSTGTPAAGFWSINGNYQGDVLTLSYDTGKWAQRNSNGFYTWESANVHDGVSLSITPYWIDYIGGLVFWKYAQSHGHNYYTIYFGQTRKDVVSWVVYNLGSKGVCDKPWAVAFEYGSSGAEFTKEDVVSVLNYGSQIPYVYGTVTALGIISYAHQALFDVVSINDSGDIGKLCMGGQWVDRSNVASFATQWAEMRSYMTRQKTPEIHLTACDLAWSLDGKSVVNYISSYGANVFATNDETGPCSTDKDLIPKENPPETTDWVLEYGSNGSALSIYQLVYDSTYILRGQW